MIQGIFPAGLFPAGLFPVSYFGGSSGGGGVPSPSNLFRYDSASIASFRIAMADEAAADEIIKAAFSGGVYTPSDYARRSLEFAMADKAAADSVLAALASPGSVAATNAARQILKLILD